MDVKILYEPMDSLRQGTKWNYGFIRLYPTTTAVLAMEMNGAKDQRSNEYKRLMGEFTTWCVDQFGWDGEWADEHNGMIILFVHESDAFAFKMRWC